ncbi:hypothetical protein EG833_02465, partial [archaeon]|nr:hypothetical protein [archaeon]
MIIHFSLTSSVSLVIRSRYVANYILYRRRYMADETKDFGEQIFPVPPKVREKAYIKSKAEYEKMWKESVENPEAFWAKQAERLDWFKKPTKIMDYSYKAPVYVKWFEDGQLNVSYNCLDRHVNGGKKNKTAIIFEGNDPSDNRTLSYMD